MAIDLTERYEPRPECVAAALAAADERLPRPPERPDLGAYLGDFLTGTI